MATSKIYKGIMQLTKWRSWAPTSIVWSEPVTPNDSEDIDVCHGLYIGSGGDIKVTSENGTVDTLENYPGGSFLPGIIKRVWSTGTSASNIHAIY